MYQGTCLQEQSIRYYGLALRESCKTCSWSVSAPLVSSDDPIDVFVIALAVVSNKIRSALAFWMVWYTRASRPGPSQQQQQQLATHEICSLCVLCFLVYLLACSLVRLLACLLACLLEACALACLLACMHACVLACLLVCLSICLRSCLLDFLLVFWLADMRSC